MEYYEVKISCIVEAESREDAFSQMEYVDEFLLDSPVVLRHDMSILE